MRICWAVCLAAVLLPSAQAAVIRVTISGTVETLEISEGPVFGYNSKQPPPRNLPFMLTYTFDDQRGGTTTRIGRDGSLIGSGELGSHAASPGLSAVLQVGDAVWEFGDSADSEVTATASETERSFKIRYATADDENWVSSVIAPAANSQWTTSGDWRQSFYAHRLDRQVSPFSIDNGTVSARGTLIATSLRVDGVDLGGQALDAKEPGPMPAGWPAREWRLAVASPRGGYVVEQITQIAVGTIEANSAPVTPLSTTYWVAWSVAPGTSITIPATEKYVNAYPPGSAGKVAIEASARFYEGLRLPAGFHAGAVPFTAAELSSTTDPHLATERATLPVTLHATFTF